MANTTNFGWAKPTVSGSADTWGTILNAVFDAVDAQLFAPAVTNTQNGASIVQWTNANAGVSATVSYRLSNDAGHAMALQLYGSGYTPTAAYDFADSLGLVANGTVGGLTFTTIGGYPIRWFTNSLERMHLDANGNLGIGTPTPTNLLHVYSAAGMSAGSMLVESASALVNPTLQLKDSTAAQDRLNAVNFLNAGGAAVGQIAYGSVNHATLATIMTFSTNATERMRFDPAGELLIGTITDNGAYLLQVNSQIFATNATIATSDARVKRELSYLSAKDLEAISKIPIRMYERIDRLEDGSRAGYFAQDWQAILGLETGIVKQPNEKAMLQLDEGAAHALKIAALEYQLKKALGRIEWLEARIE